MSQKKVLKSITTKEETNVFLSAPSARYSQASIEKSKNQSIFWNCKEEFVFLLFQQPAVRLHQSKLMSSLKKMPSVSIFLSVSPPFICQYLSINLVRLIYAIIYALLRLEVHVIRDKLNLKFQNLWMLYSESPENMHAAVVKDIKSFYTVCIMSSLLLSKL